MTSQEILEIFNASNNMNRSPPETLFYITKIFMELLTNFSEVQRLEICLIKFRRGNLVVVTLDIW